jgi:hypothetical protein
MRKGRYTYNARICFKIDFFTAIDKAANGRLESLSDIHGLLRSYVLNDKTNEHWMSLDNFLNA